MSWVAATVGEHGWAISGRHGDEAAPPWAYSVGMWLSCQTPELVVCGLPVENAASVINAIGARIADGADYSPDDVLDDVCPAPLTFRPVEVSWRATTGLLAISDAFYGMVRPPYLQVVWSDKNGRFPWEPGFQAAFNRMQPLLWLPRDDNPPSPWTRLDQLGLSEYRGPSLLKGACKDDAHERSRVVRRFSRFRDGGGVPRPARGNLTHHRDRARARHQVRVTDAPAQQDRPPPR